MYPDGNTPHGDALGPTPGDPDALYTPQVTVHTFDTLRAFLAWFCTFPDVTSEAIAGVVDAWRDRERGAASPAQAAARRRLLKAAHDWGGLPAELRRTTIADQLIVARSTADDIFTAAGWQIHGLRAAYQLDLLETQAKNRANRADLPPDGLLR